MEKSGTGVAVGHATGEREVYVGADERGGVEPGASRVAVFGPSGVLQGLWTGEDTPSGRFSQEILSVAVDESGLPGDWGSGDVLVSDQAHDVVDVVAPVAGGGEPPAGNVHVITGTCVHEGEACPGEVVPFENSQGVAVDEKTGEVFVVDNNRVVDVFRLTGVPGEVVYVGQLTGFESQVKGVAVDGFAADGGDVYVWEGGPSEGGSVVDEFGVVERALLGQLTGVPSGAFEDVHSTAADGSSHDVFVGDFRDEALVGVVDVFGPDLVVPNVVSSGVSGVSAGSATFNGVVSTLGEGAASCRFVWGTTAAFGNVAPCVEGQVEGEGVPVHAVVQGLAPGTRYFYRLQATNLRNGQTAEGVESEDQSFTTSGAVVESMSVSQVTSGSALLGAVVNPDGFLSSYVFEYGPTVEYGSVVEGESVGAGFEGVAVSRPVTGLAAGSEYHYRVVAVSVVEGVAVRSVGPDETFITQTGGPESVADGRVWELVSAPDKHGAHLEPIDSNSTANGTLIQAAPDGDAIAYIADAPTEDVPRGNANDVQVVSARSGSGWSTRDLTVSHVGATDGNVGLGNEYRFFSTDLSSAIVQPFGAFVACSVEGVSQPCLSPAASEQTAFSQTVYVSGDPARACEGGGCYQPLVTGCPTAPAECSPAVAQNADVAPGTMFGVAAEGGSGCPPKPLCGPQFLAGTHDAGHVVLSSQASLVGSAPPESLYEWNATAPAGQRLVLVSVLPEAEGGAPVSGASLGNESLGMRGAISGDGSRVFFSAHGALYMRDVPAGKTMRLDTGALAGSPAAAFQSATADGSRVLFRDGRRLTADSGATSGKKDLYECVISEEIPGDPTCGLTDLTPQNSEGESAGVQGGVIGVSEDGSSVYFVADGVLENGGVPVAGAVRGDCSSPGTNTKPGASCNLYVRHGGVTRLVAALSGEDFPDWGGGGPGNELETLTSHVSPGGGWLEFMSVRSLTGYDNEDISSRRVGERLDEEVYSYDAGSGRVVCVSCEPSGGRPAGVEYGPGGANVRLVGGKDVWNATSVLGGDVPGWTPYENRTALYQSRLVSDNGRVFFNAVGGLVPGDVNGGWDVYEWEPVGVGGCGVGVVSGGFVYEGGEGGCVGLVSSGESPDESAFLDASATGGRDGGGSEGGGDVFFLTTGKLAGEDFDDSYDVYDAHECVAGLTAACSGGGSAPVVLCVSADACRAAPAGQPEVFGAPASATFSGPGNPATVVVSTAVKKTTAGEIKAERLARALKQCHKDKNKKRRAACEKQARKRYGAVKKAKKSNQRAK